MIQNHTVELRKLRAEHLAFWYMALVCEHLNK